LQAAYGGHLEVLQCYRAHWSSPRQPLTCLQAAYGGHPDVLQWARANGCPYNELTSAQAAQEGYLHILQLDPGARVSGRSIGQWQQRTPCWVYTQILARARPP
jgi:hypothetical protein